MRISSIFLFAATVFLLAGTLWMREYSANRIPEPLARPLEEISASIEGWTAVDDRKLDAQVLSKLIPTSYLARGYGKGGARLDLFVAFYSQQRAGESMHSPKHCLPGSGWEIWRHDSALIPTASGQVQVNKYSIHNSGVRMLMFYWYQSANRIIANEYMGKILLARDTLVSRRTAGSIVRIMVQDSPGAEREAVAFAARLIPEVQRCFTSEAAAVNAAAR